MPRTNPDRIYAVASAERVAGPEAALAHDVDKARIDSREGAPATFRVFWSLREALNRERGAR